MIKFKTENTSALSFPDIAPAHFDSRNNYLSCLDTRHTQLKRPLT